MKQKSDGSNNQLQPTTKAFYEEIPPSVINPENTQNSVGDTSHKQATQNFKNSSGESGYELMASVRVQRDLGSNAPLKCGRTHEPSNKSDRYVQTMIQKQPALYHNITPGHLSSDDKRESENPSHRTSQRSNKE